MSAARDSGLDPTSGEEQANLWTHDALAAADEWRRVRILADTALQRLEGTG